MDPLLKTDGEYPVRDDLRAIDVSVGIDADVPTVAGERKFEQAEQSEKVHRRESLSSTSSRSGSWRRLSDRVRDGEDYAGDAATGSSDQTETRQLESWEDAGGQMPPAAAPVPILIIDNDVSSASSLELTMHAAGYPETRVAYSGQAALAMAAVFKPSVILMEVDLLDVNGYDLAQTLRERARTRKLRLIALTTRRGHEGRELARAAGFECYLLKPVVALDLSNLLKMPGRPAR